MKSSSSSLTSRQVGRHAYEVQAQGHAAGVGALHIRSPTADAAPHRYTCDTPRFLLGCVSSSRCFNRQQSMLAPSCARGERGIQGQAQQKTAPPLAPEHLRPVHAQNPLLACGGLQFGADACDDIADMPRGRPSRPPARRRCANRRSRRSRGPRGRRTMTRRSCARGSSHRFRRRQRPPRASRPGRPRCRRRRSPRQSRTVSFKNQGAHVVPGWVAIVLELAANGEARLFDVDLLSHGLIASFRLEEPLRARSGKSELRAMRYAIAQPRTTLRHHKRSDAPRHRERISTSLFTLSVRTNRRYGRALSW